MTQTGPIEAVSYAAGRALSAFAGVRMTRLAHDAAVGDDALVLERTDGLPPSGVLVIDHVTYRYGRVAHGAVYDLTVHTPQGVFGGVRLPHARNTVVLDTSRRYSALDQLRRGLFVSTAEGSDLAVLGRLYGVPRNNDIADDDTYRRIIGAIAFAARPTRVALAAALDAMVGPGRYALHEDPREPATVLVYLDESLVTQDGAQGGWYVAGSASALPDAGGATTKDAGVRVAAVYGAPRFWQLDFAAGDPRTLAVQDAYRGTYTPLTFEGAPAPKQVVQGTAASYAPGAGVFLATCPLPTDATVRAQARIACDPTQAQGHTVDMQLVDGTHSYTVQVRNTGLFVSMALVDGNDRRTIAQAPGTYPGTQPLDVVQTLTPDAWQLHVNGRLALNLPRAQAGAAADASPHYAVGSVLDPATGSVYGMGLEVGRGQDRLPRATTTQAKDGTFHMDGAGKDDALEVVLEPCLSGQVVPDSAGPINHRLSDGPPPSYLLWPIYLSDPQHLALSYLNLMVAAGVSVKIISGLERAK